MKDNKLIAEFMGAEYTGTRVKDYDTSWDWLMPVVIKQSLYIVDYIIGKQ